MKIQIFFLYFLSLISGNIYAQSLDIGDIEIEIGQDKKSVLKSLSLYFLDQKYRENDERYDVYDKSGGKMLGVLLIDDGKVSAIMKYYRFFSKATNAAHAMDEWGLYFLARSKLHDRGGKQCDVTERVMVKTEMVYGFETKCGAYTLVYHMPRESVEDGMIMIYVEK